MSRPYRISAIFRAAPKYLSHTVDLADSNRCNPKPAGNAQGIFASTPALCIATLSE